MQSPLERAATLSCWKAPVEPQPVGGGRTNHNFVVEHAGERLFVRIGDDIPVHGIMRFHERAASRAAAAAGISPPTVHEQPGALVMQFIEGRTFGEEDVRDADNLRRILPLMHACHREMPLHFRGPALIFWVFQVVRDYANTLREGNSRMTGEVDRFLAAARQLEAEIGPIDLVFGHNDLLADNFIDDGQRLWLVDWDYAGFNSPLFDLGGIASNSQLEPEQEDWLLANYFEAPVTDALRRRYTAMKCASLLREAMWSMVSELHLSVDFDYVAYTEENLARFEQAWTAFQSR